MPKTDTQTLKVLIRRSRLLTDDRKASLLEQLASMPPKAQKKLQSILDEEGEVLSVLTERIIADSIESNEGDFFAQLDTFLTQANKKLRKTQESAERAHETEKSEHFFDEIDT